MYGTAFDRHSVVHSGGSRESGDSSDEFGRRDYGGFVNGGGSGELVDGGGHGYSVVNEAGEAVEHPENQEPISLHQSRCCMQANFEIKFIFFCSISSAIIAELRYYEKLSVFGNKKVQAFVENVMISRSTNNPEEEEIDNLEDGDASANEGETISQN
uniref:Uncharacterized protein n=1 Tax=Panagrolaimus davidi TaxID=227884 RepID=A0A914QL58_9BILA